MDTNSFLVGMKLETIGGVKYAELSGDQVRGRFKETLSEITSASQPNPLETFLNCGSDPTAIVQFTQSFGPLKQEPKPGSEFLFYLQEFMDAQQLLRGMWRDKSHYEKPIDLLKEHGGNYRFQKGSITYAAPTLFVQLIADLIIRPVERLRVCQQRGCSHPYFFAKHRNRRYCSDECAEQSQKDFNKEWWQTQGADWRRNQRKKVP